MVPYIDSRGVRWEIQSPSEATLVDTDGKEFVSHDLWTAHIATDAYNYKAGQTLVIGDDAEVVIENIETTYAKAIPVKRQDSPPVSGGSSWLWLLAFLWLLDEKKGR